MNLNHEIKETLQSFKRIFLFRKYKTIERSSKQNRVTLSSSKGTTWKEAFRKGLMMGFVRGINSKFWFKALLYAVRHGEGCPEGGMRQETGESDMESAQVHYKKH